MVEQYNKREESSMAVPLSENIQPYSFFFFSQKAIWSQLNIYTEEWEITGVGRNPEAITLK